MAQKKSAPGNSPKKTVKAKAKPASASARKIVGAKKPPRVNGSPNAVEQELAQRNAELQIINSIQQGLAAELDFQAIVDLVGDKLTEILKTQELGIRWYDEKTNLVHFLYEYEHGNRLTLPPTMPTIGGVFEKILKTRQPVVRNTRAEYTGGHIPDTDFSESIAAIPIIGSDRVIGAIQLENYEREYAYGESELRLLTTIAASLGTALENARLFDETQRLLNITEDRAAELAIVNSVQEGLASKLDMQAIYDLVGDKLRDTFDPQKMSISTIDYATETAHLPYLLEKGKRLFVDPIPLDDLDRHLIQARQMVVINQDFVQQTVRLGAVLISGTESVKSGLWVPLVAGDIVRGVVYLANHERENAFSESDVRLLQTLANSMSVALENARLFDEVQKKNVEITESLEQQTATSEILRVIASSPTDIEPVLDAVAENAARVCGANDALIFRVEGDRLRTVAHYGPIPVQENEQDIPLNRDSVAGRAIELGQAMHIHDILSEQSASDFPVSKAIHEKSQRRTLLATPLIREGIPIGLIAIRRIKVDPFTDKQVALLKTFADQAAIAIENVRLFTETQRLLKETEQRNAELAIINSVQEGLASKLDMQAIYDLVGDRLRDIFDPQKMFIATLDHAAETTHYQYLFEKGKRLYPDPSPFNEFVRHQIQTSQLVVINVDFARRSEQLGMTLIPGTQMPKSGVLVPLVVGDVVRGIVYLANHEREHAFSDSDVRLLQTLANSMSVALENARLFDETQRLFKAEQERVAELAIINSVQAALAAELNIQGIYEAVGEKIREIFRNADVGFRIYDTQTNLLHVPFAYENGQRIKVASYQLPVKGFGRHVLSTGETLVVNENMAQVMEKYGSNIIPGTSLNKSLVLVPLKAGNQVRGTVELSSSKSENAFSQSDVRLLQTLANSMSVALENARLFDETQRLFKAEQERVAELAIINSVQEGLASNLDMQAIIDLVGDKIREIFDAPSNGVSLYDRISNTVSFPYIFERGQRFYATPAPLGKGLTSHVIQTRQSLVINRDMGARVAELGWWPVAGTEIPESYVGVPIMAGAEIIGVIDLMNFDHEDAFSQSQVNLLSTLANSLGIALENARLFDETQRLLKETEERASELSIINHVQLGLASKLEVHAIYELIGDQLRNMFDSQAISIVSFDLERNMRHYEFVLEKGQRMDVPDAAIPPMSQHIIRTKQPLLVNENLVATLAAIGISTQTLPGTEPTKSLLRVPIIASGQVRGVIGLDNIDRENAFTETDVRLLSTLANGMGVALESARLFNEATEARAAADKANATKSTFLSNMSHELRTPLNAIIGFTRIVRRKAEGSLPEKQTENLDKILTSAEHLLGLINTVLDIAKIEAGRMDVHAADFDMAATAEQCITLASTLLKPNVVLKQKVDENLPPMHSDQEKVRQIVLNLLSNAAKFTHEGSITLAIEKKEKDISIHVIDSGIGISEEALGRVFEEFQQADATTTRKYGGTGLGLAISRNLARLLGGDLTVTSQLGKGSTFTLTLPIQYQPKNASKPDPEAVSVR